MAVLKNLGSDMGGITLNKVILMGRLTRDPEIRYSQGENKMAVGRYTLAVDRKYRREGEDNADFVSCMCFGKAAEFAEKYLHKGTKIIIAGRIQTGSYTNKDGNRVFTTDVVVEEQEFAESKGSADNPIPPSASTSDGFMNIPEGIDDSELPFN